MVSKVGFLCVVASFMVAVQGYSGGAPVDVCEDMIPKHPVPPQKTDLPYTVKVSQSNVRAGQIVKITLSGKEAKEGFKGFLIQVRQGAKNLPIGKFEVDEKDKYVKTINCGQGQQNAATHKNSEVKNNLDIDWKVPSSIKGQAQVYVTIAKDGGTFWTAKPTATIKFN